MKISVQHLFRFAPDAPRDLSELRALLDDVGVEVKRVQDSPDGAVFTLELLANRGDHYCYAGVAQEIVGRLGGRRILPESPALPEGDAPVPLRIETEQCLRYAATLFELSAKRASLPDDLMVPLRASELQSIGIAVDVTNLVNLEIGQPTHAFDADKLQGGITVRLSRKGERAWPLFRTEPVELAEGTLVIADDVKVIAIAGVIGCEDSKVDANSRRILLESATFDPIAVRKSARRLGLQTAASQRYERGADPALTPVAAARVAFLLEKYGSAKRVGAMGIAGAWKDPDRTISVSASAIEKFYGRTFTSQEVRERLERYGFRTEETGMGPLSVHVPTHRLWDVEEISDVLEEIGRSVGYDVLPSALPTARSGSVPTEDERAKYRAEEVLLSNGFFEVFTDSFHDRAMREKLGLDEADPLHPHVAVLNAQDGTFSLLRNNAVGYALRLVADNLDLGVDDVRAYEWARTFHPDPSAENRVCTERGLLWLVAVGPSRAKSWADKPGVMDFWTMKGLVSHLAQALSLPLTIDTDGPTLPTRALLHPGRSATIVLNGRPVGVLGEIHPAPVAEFGIKRARPYYLEIDRAALVVPERPPVPVLPPTLSPIARALAIVLPTGVTAQTVIEAIRASGPAWLESIRADDVFVFEEAGVAVRSVTFKLQFANDGARSATDINALCEQIAQGVERDLGSRGVKQRK